MTTLLDEHSPRPDNTDLIRLLGERFISRKDVKAAQNRDGSWMPVTDTGRAEGNRLPFTLADFNKHLSGDLTLGHYLLNPADDTCKLFAFDIDLRKEGRWFNLEDGDEFMAGGTPCNPREVWLDESHPGHVWLRMQLRCMAEALALAIDRRLGIPVAVLDSGGKGLHVYGFTGSIPAEIARTSAIGVLDGFGCFEPTKGDNFYRHKTGYEVLEIEVFPKQQSLSGKDLGNLMRLPLGINRKTNKSAQFIALKNGYTERWLTMDPFRAMGGQLPWE